MRENPAGSGLFLVDWELPLEEICFKHLRTGAAALVEDVPIDLGDHIRLGVPGIALHRLDVAVGEDELIGDAAMPQAVESDLRQTAGGKQRMESLQKKAVL